MRSLFIASFCALFLFAAFSGVALAQGAGITLKPATIEENMDPGATRDFTFVIVNESTSDQLYYLGKRDIVGVRDGSVPVYAEEGQEKTIYELSEWITLASDTVMVPAGQETSVNFTIKVPEGGAPGSHFAGIFISVEPPKLRESGAAIGYEVANIVSIRVAGEVDERASIRQFSTDNYIYGSPNVEFSLKIENSGNTLVRPRGPLAITNMFGKEVGGGMIFNEPAAGVFPRDTREFVFSWESDEPGFGRYEAVVSPVFGEAGANQTISSSVTFWILPMNIIGPVLGILLFTFLVIYIGTRLYVRRKLAYYSATASGRKLVRRDSSTGTPLLLVFLVMLSVSAIFFIVLLLLFS
jgi:hypothetical protein